MTRFAFIKILTLLILVPSCNPLFSQTVSQYPFYLKGFSIIINDDAFDENGNHILVGEIRAIEDKAENRDTAINRIFGLKGYSNDDAMGIIIAMDKNNKILKIAKSYCGEKVMYDPNKKLFTIGANFFDFLKMGDNSFSAWQPVIVQVDIQLKSKSFFIRKPYSCILDNMVIENDEILIFTRSNIKEASERTSNEKTEIIRVNTTQFHTDSARPWIKVLNPVSGLQTPYDDVGRITLSDVSKSDSAYYFTTSNLNQENLSSIHHLYQLKNNQLTVSRDFPVYLNWTHKGADWIIINGFVVKSPKTYLFLTHKAATDKEMVFSKTDENFENQLSHKIPLNDYADFNRILELTNENILILAVSNKETWSYFLYDQGMQLIKEINSTISKDYRITLFKSIGNERIECVFYVDQVSRKDCVLQTLSLN